MKNKELIKQINKLNSIEPDLDWKKENRDVLFSQISNSEPRKINIFVRIRDFVSQPSFALSSFVFLLVFSSVFGVRFINLKPNNSLYIARIISEKAQLAITFDEEKKTRLGIKFANERAKSIASVLSDASYSNLDYQEEAEKLTDSFKKEINTVKENVKKIKMAEKEDSSKQIDSEDGEEEVIFIGASLRKDDQGLEIVENNKATSSDEVETSQEVASSSEEKEGTEGGEDNNELNKKIEEAEVLFDQKDYEGALNKLNEIDDLLESEDSNDVDSDQEEGATSTSEE